MDDYNYQKIKLTIAGMHCASCEVLIERQFKTVPGVEKVHANFSRQRAVLYCSQSPDISQLQQLIGEHGYRISRINGESVGGEVTAQRPSWRQLGAIALIVVAGYLLLQRLNILPSVGISDNISFGMVFAVGLVASISTCMAVTGGLLLAVSAKNSERHPELTSGQKIKPLLYFNAGRVVGYTVLGGVIGALGSVISLSDRLNGVVTIVASLAMVVLGLQLLHLLPWLNRLMPKLPKRFSHRIHDLSESDSRLAPFSLGALTFFLPCGFTQALQLYILSQGGLARGALTMLFFALGTLPALLSISALSGLVKGKAQSYLLKFAGVTAILIGLLNVRNGLVLAGNPFGNLLNRETPVAAAALDPNVKIINGKQVISMKVDYLDYQPYRFTVQKGVPVEWIIDGTQAAGCMSSFIVPKLGIREFLPKVGTKTITFTPQEVGTYEFSCAMGMGTPGAAIVVVDRPSPAPTTAACDPKISNCLL